MKKMMIGTRLKTDGYYESCIVDVENNRIEITVYLTKGNEGENGYRRNGKNGEENTNT